MVTMEATVFVVDDDDSVREGIQELMESVGLHTRPFSSAQEFLNEDVSAERGCLLLDVRMPGMSGLKLQEELNQRDSILPIVFLTGHGDIPMAVEALRRGAVDFLEKPSGGQHLLDSVYEAIELYDHRQEVDTRNRILEGKLASLTPREKEVFGYLMLGESIKEIAWTIGLSRKTVDWHVSMIREKMGVDSTGQLLLLFHRSGELQSA